MLKITGIGSGGASAPPKLLILKIRAKSVEIWAKCVKTFAKSFYVLWFCKSGTQNQNANVLDLLFFWRSCFFVFFGQVRVIWASLGVIGAKMVLGVLRFEKWAQHEKKCSRFFGGHFFGVFSGKFGEIWAKIFRISEHLPAPTAVLQIVHL